MPERVRFFLDEHIAAAVGAGLKFRGIDVLTVQEAGRSGLSDYDQLKFASEHDRVIVSFDSDFLKIASQGVHHSGLAWCPATKYSIGDLIRRLVLLHAVLNREDMRDHIEYL
ncbi:MAG: DUF5615 family PIN-like protein [Candidatus Melainabacteria bacterium]|nr:DUF5615 family PIN-like protein [Candidatus Melainabacteria bacterium]